MLINHKDLLPSHIRYDHTVNLTVTANQRTLLNDKTTLLKKVNTEVMEKCNELWFKAG